MLSGVSFTAGENRLAVAFQVKRIGRGRLQSGARGEKRVAQNAVHPSAEIRALLERAKSFQRLGIGFLHQVFGFVAVLSEPVGKVVEPLKQGHG